MKHDLVESCTLGITYAKDVADEANAQRREQGMRPLGRQLPAKRHRGVPDVVLGVVTDSDSDSESGSDSDESSTSESNI